jgi:glucose-1-phosphate cytidylyltransferase
LEAFVQVVILAGGLGTRLSEETVSIPKPMVTIGEDPIIVHLMRFFASFGHTKFLVALGYKGYVIKEFFANYALHNSDLRINIFDKRIEVIENRGENWEIELIDTGQLTMTGGRILRLENYLEEDFLLTYGDGLSDVNLDSLILHHRESQRLATVTAVQPPARFGSLEVEDGAVKKFGEKIAQDAGWINGGFFCFSKKILNYLEDDNSILEGKPLERLVQDNQLSGFVHDGFWQPMDTMRDKMTLEAIWQKGNAPWKR